MRQNYRQRQCGTILGVLHDFFELVYVDSLHLADFFSSTDLLDQIGMLASFGIHIVQTSSFRRSWTTTSSNSCFSAWSQTLTPAVHQKVRTDNKILEAIS